MSEYRPSSDMPDVFMSTARQATGPEIPEVLTPRDAQPARRPRITVATPRRVIAPCILLRPKVTFSPTTQTVAPSRTPSTRTARRFSTERRLPQPACHAHRSDRVPRGPLTGPLTERFAHASNFGVS